MTPFGLLEDTTKAGGDGHVPILASCSSKKGGKEKRKEKNYLFLCIKNEEMIIIVYQM